jgi:trehalose synthase
MTETASWYHDAIIYELHVKAFYDANGDGIGDFRGLTEKLDYLCHLGVTAVWLLPFYPSPLRDDGYDIADYRDVHPSYGNLRDFRQLLDAAHRRGLRVITELVINHTSDEHPWFQQSRRAKPGSALRNMYVWSDTNQRYEGTRIIFCDTEKSNWTWDPVAEAYYWHRFFSHQPDLNFDNPRVFREVTRAMQFWLDMGVDGLRLDAIPYLCEREGTNNENLPETHAVIKKLRAWLDSRYTDRMFLAEANQWPEDVRPYFGDGDECHMAFHFPLMPRIYMALAHEDRYPVTDILRQTPEIPPDCQWAIFLRNHDELTLEMVTARERDYLWDFYAADPHARINLGIRRRLAPLLGGDRRKIELLNSLLLSMPGTPVLYYGDEIGMGDNIYLGDRNGVRTPMQWSPDRNGGFSIADPQRLFLPPIMDPLYGYEAVNVETQMRHPASLFNWTRRAIAARKERRAFGSGEIRLLYPRNRKVLAYLRSCPEEVVLCVANLASSPQPVELDLSEFKGRVPIELIGRSAFPPIGDLPYFLTLPAYAFFWFLLAEEAEAPNWHEPYVTPLPEFQTLVITGDWTMVLGGRNGDVLASRILPEFLPNQRWFSGKASTVRSVGIANWVGFGAGAAGECGIAFIDVDSEGQAPQSYSLPLGIAWESATDDPLQRLQPMVLARVRRAASVGVLHDAAASPELAKTIFDAVARNAEIDGPGGRLVCKSTAAFAEFSDIAPEQCARLGVEQSNTSTLLDNRVVLKFYRRVQVGIHPEVEIGRFLTDVALYANVPRLLGSIELISADGEATAVAMLQEFVRNQGDAWMFTLEHLDRTLNAVELLLPGSEHVGDDPHAGYWVLVETMARRIGELHIALANAGSGDPAFAPEPMSIAERDRWQNELLEIAMRARTAVMTARTRQKDPRIEELATHILSYWEVLQKICTLPGSAIVSVASTRVHGDLHLGQVVVAGSDCYLLDFEGEPLRPIQTRRAKTSPLRDVAGMIRSFEYAGETALARRGSGPVAPRADGRKAIDTWLEQTKLRFIAAYRETTLNCMSVPPVLDDFNMLLDVFTLEKTLYEVCYEAANRPDWLGIPLSALAQRLVVPVPDSDPA